MIVGVPRETYPGERRVALVPALVSALTKAKLDVVVEKGAGGSAGFSDDAYRDKGAKIDTRAEVFAADILLCVRALGANLAAGRQDLDLLRAGQTVIGFCEPLAEPQAAEELASRGCTLLAMELVPRISRAQTMDALSSMATIAGYRAVLLAATALPRLFPMLTTAAGTIVPAKVFVMGAGVAGLQAIATSRRLGAVVTANDVRPAVKEQVESLGARFIELPLATNEAEAAGGYAKAMDEDFYRRQRELNARVVADSDVVLTTAAIPGHRAPILVTAEMVAQMQPGSVIVDLAAERGGNCDLTQPGQTVVEHGVTILGPTNLPAEIPYHASQLYSKNLTALLIHLTKDGQFVWDMNDEITRETLVCRDGQILHPRVRERLESVRSTNGGQE
ncbi:MAG: Re/Si-specific NAD(P)(+) transhydrogenase subunit alpha [Pirellulales bacterium]